MRSPYWPSSNQTPRSFSSDSESSLPCVCVDSCEVIASLAGSEKHLEAHHIDLILCDDQMPEETGLMFLARIRGRYPDLKRILFSGFIDKEMLSYALNHADVMRVIEKPFDSKELLEMVQRSLADQPEPKPKRPDILPILFRQALSVTVFCSSAAFSLIILGTIGIAFLYFLKTALGINFFEDIHFRDLFPNWIK